MGLPTSPEVLRIKITHHRFSTLFLLWRNAFMLWDWARIFPTNPPSLIGKNYVWWRGYRGAAFARNGKISWKSVQHVYSWKWSKFVIVYQSTTRPCFLELSGQDPGHARHKGSYLTSILIWLRQQLLEDHVNVLLLLEKRWHGVSPRKFTLNSKKICYLSSKPGEGRFMRFGLIGGGNICLGFGGNSWCFVRSAVPTVLRSMGSVHECPDTCSQFLKALLATFHGFCQIHKGMCLSQRACQNFHARFQFCVGNCVKRGEALWVPFDRIVAPVIHNSYTESFLTQTTSLR